MRRFALLISLERVKTADAAIVAGVALIAGAALLQFYRTDPMQAHAALLRQQAYAANKNSSRLRLNALQSETPADETRLTRFYRHFPLQVRAPDSLAIIFRAAEEQGLLLAEGTYQQSAVKDLPLSAYQISLPVKGSYAQIRKYVARLLTALPAASVDELSFSRDVIANAQVDAKIRITLYLRARDAAK